MTAPDSGSPDNFGEQFLDDYFAECDEHIAAVRRHLLALDQQVGEGRMDSALLDELFRSFHTIKGISGWWDFARKSSSLIASNTLRAVRQEIFLNSSIDGLIESVASLDRRLRRAGRLRFLRFQTKKPPRLPRLQQRYWNGSSSHFQY
jgi:hypothetical protein